MRTELLTHLGNSVSFITVSPRPAMFGSRVTSGSHHVSELWLQRRDESVLLFCKPCSLIRADRGILSTVLEKAQVKHPPLHPHSRSGPSPHSVVDLHQVTNNVGLGVSLGGGGDVPAAERLRLRL